MFYNVMYGFYQYPATFVVMLVLLSVWELVWKGWALWYSAQSKQKGWYIAMLVLNTAGLLPIIYLLWFKPKQKREAPLKQATRSVRRKK